MKDLDLKLKKYLLIINNKKQKINNFLWLVYI